MATRRSASRSSVTGAITDLQRRIRLLQNKSVPTGLANQVVARSAIQPRAVSTDQIALDAVTNDQISADAVKREQIDVGAVGTTEIDNFAVTNEKLGPLSVTNGKIDDEQVDTRILGPLAVTNAKLNDAAVELRNMTPNSVQNNALITDSVNFRTIATNAVGNENMLGDAIGNDELQNDSVAQGNLRNDSVGFGELQSNSVGNSTLQTGSVTDSKFGGTLSASKVGSGIDGSKITQRTLSGNRIINGTVDTAALRSTASVVAFGLDVGFGISKSGNTIRVDASALSNTYVSRNAFNGHTHRYDRPGAAFVRFGTHYTDGPRTSLAKAKKNISKHTTVDPKNLLNLQLKKFQYKRSSSGYHSASNRQWMHGYMIDDLLELGFEEVIHYDKKGNPEKLDYALMSTLVLELVKVQQGEIELLRQRIEDLEEKN